MTITINKIWSGIFDESKDEKDYHRFEILCDGKKVGSMEIVDRFNEDNDVAYVERIDIDEEFRNQGIGTEVLNNVLQDEYYNIVLCPDNEDAQRLYERIGEEYTSIYDCDTDFSYFDQGYGVYVI